MKLPISIFLVGIMLGAGVAWFLGHPKIQQHESEPEKRTEVGHRELESGIKISPEIQETMGLVVVSLTSTNVSPQSPAFASAVDVAPLVQSLQELALARLQSHASQVEHRRLKSLFEQGQTASAKAYEASELAMKRDQLAVANGEALLRVRWGEDLSKIPDLDVLIDAVQHQQRTLIRVTLAPGEGNEALPVAAWVGGVGQSEERELVRILGRCPIRDAFSQGESFWAVADGHRWGSGAPLLSWVSRSKETQSGWVIPGSAILRHEGTASVFVRRGTDRFERVRIELGTQISGGWLGMGPLTNGDALVLTGSQQLLSSEMKPSGGEE